MNHLPPLDAIPRHPAMSRVLPETEGVNDNLLWRLCVAEFRNHAPMRVDQRRSGP